MIEGDGPVVWLLVIPTTKALMEEFMAGRLTEHALYERTPEGIVYQAIYLCSVLVLPEYRGRGLAERATLDTIDAIRADHPIEALFCWTFSEAGGGLAERVAGVAGLPVLKRPH